VTLTVVAGFIACLVYYIFVLSRGFKAFKNKYDPYVNQKFRYVIIICGILMLITVIGGFILFLFFTDVSFTIPI